MFSANNSLSPNEVAELIAVINNNVDMSYDLYCKMYEHFHTEMPYGTAKARTGDPIEWICERLVEMGEDEIRANFAV